MYFTFYIVQGTFLLVRRSERVGEWSNPQSFFPEVDAAYLSPTYIFPPVAAIQGTPAIRLPNGPLRNRPISGGGSRLFPPQSQ